MDELELARQAKNAARREKYKTDKGRRQAENPQAPNQLQQQGV
jgi:hypothetical protein